MERHFRQFGHLPQITIDLGFHHLYYLSHILDPPHSPHSPAWGGQPEVAFALRLRSREQALKTGRSWQESVVSNSFTPGGCMYSLVLMMAMSGPAVEAPAFGHHSCNGSSCSGSSCSGSSCSGGHHFLGHHHHSSCHGSSSCSGYVSSGCHGGSSCSGSSCSGGHHFLGGHHHHNSCCGCTGVSTSCGCCGSTASYGCGGGVMAAPPVGTVVPPATTGNPPVKMPEPPKK